MEDSSNQRRGIKRSATQTVGTSSAIQQELHDENDGHIKEPKLEMKDPLHVDGADQTFQEQFFMVEEIDIKPEPKTEEDYEIEDYGDGVGSSIAADTKYSAGFPDDEDVSGDANAPGTSRRSRKTTSDKDRERVIAANDKGYTVRMIADMLLLKRSTVYGILKKFWKTGAFEASKRGGNRSKKLTSAALADVHSWMDEDCTTTLKTLAQKVFERHAIQVCAITIGREMRNFIFSFKRMKIHPERKNNADAMENRKEYAVAYSRIPQAAAVFIGDVAFNVNIRTITANSGAEKTGSKVILRTRYVGISCAMNHGRILHYSWTYRTMNQEMLEKFIKQVKEKLNWQNAEQRPLIILDDAAFPKCTAVRETISAEGFEVKYLPPNSAFLNPNETFFNDLKNIVKRANPKNEQELITAIQKGADLMTAEDCEGYFCDMLKCMKRCRAGEEIAD